MAVEKAPHSHTGHRQRLRQRFCANGLSGFASHEVLELLLGYAIPRQDVNPLAHQLIERYGSLHAVLEAGVADLQRVEGVGEYTAVMLSLFPAVAIKCEETRQGKKEVLRNQDEAQAHCVRLLRGCKEEHCYAVYLSGQMEVLADVLISRGSLREVPSYPRVIVDYALRYNAHAVILCHNHPGGSLYPSAADIVTTQELKQTMERLEIRLLDHFVVVGLQAFSMMDKQLLDKIGGEMVAHNRAANSAGDVAVKRCIRQLRQDEEEP